MESKVKKSKNNGKSHHNENHVKIFNRNDRLLQEIINYLRLHYGLCAAYLLNKSTVTTQHHYHYPPGKEYRQRTFIYTLVIITQPSRRTSGPRGYSSNSTIGDLNPTQLTDILYNHTQKQAKVYVIPFTYKALSNQLQMGNNFLSNTLLYTHCIYTDTSVMEGLYITSPIDHPKVWGEVRQEWNVRLERAAYLHDIVGVIVTHEDPVAYFGVLHNVLQQTCLGLLAVFWEYKPAYMGLSYLMHLCSLFTELPQTVFPTNSYTGHRLLHHLQHAPHYLRYKTRSKLSHNDADKAWRKCSAFLEKAEVLVEQYLKQRSCEKQKAS